MDPETGKFIKPLKITATGLGGSSPEGPHMYKINGYYYLKSAEGGTGYEHREVIQRSWSPWGPFEASPVNLIVSNMNDPQNSCATVRRED
jgi:alpha-N-arabinofuranosidase